MLPHVRNTEKIVSESSGMVLGCHLESSSINFGEGL